MSGQWLELTNERTGLTTDQGNRPMATGQDTLTTAPISSSEGWTIIGDNIPKVLLAQYTIPLSRRDFQGYYHCLTFWPSLLLIVVREKSLAKNLNIIIMVSWLQNSSSIMPLWFLCPYLEEAGQGASQELASITLPKSQIHKTNSHRCLCHHGCGGQTQMKGNLLNAQTWLSIRNIFINLVL